MNEALVERMPVATGADSETFAALYERTFPRVYAYVASLLGDRSAAEDVTAQAFERAYRRRATYRTRRGSQGGGGPAPMSSRTSEASVGTYCTEIIPYTVQ